MDVKSDKTFEEIVERIIALFKPEPGTVQVPQQPSSQNSPDTQPSDASAAASSDETEA